jgi:hypothetical protein
MEKKKSTDLDNLIITELMLVKADWQRTFVAEISREATAEGVPIVRGTVVVNEGKIWSQAESQEELGKYLDDICQLKLNYGLHCNQGVNTDIGRKMYFLT